MIEHEGVIYLPVEPGNKDLAQDTMAPDRHKKDEELETDDSLDPSYDWNTVTNIDAPTVIDVVPVIDVSTSDGTQDSCEEPWWWPSEQLIENSQMFKALDLEDRVTLLASGERTTFEPGDVILTEGEAGEFFYLIEDGEVEVSTTVDSRTLTLATLTRGAIFGEVPAFSNKPRTANVTAASLVDAIRFSITALREILERRPDIRDELEALILDRAQITIGKISNPKISA